MSTSHPFMARPPFPSLFLPDRIIKCPQAMWSYLCDSLVNCVYKMPLEMNDIFLDNLPATSLFFLPPFFWETISRLKCVGVRQRWVIRQSGSSFAYNPCSVIYSAIPSVTDFFQPSPPLALSFRTAVELNVRSSSPMSTKTTRSEAMNSSAS